LPFLICGLVLTIKQILSSILFEMNSTYQAALWLAENRIAEKKKETAK
jgi:hypothetical protein